ncbi:FMN-binding protein [Halothiobacillus diazotrophicus]|uniref:FMN-binding protein n=1 Tax=Halothiobacillus diazotrophicus TaxID=1860122 RepID=A0A191ZJT4_9GAMM|nr:FMN-binding protein [Halothiobacillus diazotrophicus]ANJ68144.1 FMN-binding protein [Halothiobacillus diazotrophicus]
MKFTPLLVVAPILMPAAQATEYLDTAAAQRILFPSASRFVVETVKLNDQQKGRIAELSGVTQRWQDQPVWRVETDGQPTGWYIEDRVIGKHEFIRYALALSPQGQVLGIEIMDYRETYGGEVRQAEWRGQFLGKTRASTLSLGSDIRNISGATLSCRNITNGVKRLLALQKVVLDGRIQP